MSVARARDRGTSAGRRTTPRRPARTAAALTAALLGVAAAAGAPSSGDAAPAAPGSVPSCAPSAPPFYAFELVTTARVPGTARATGEAEVRFPPSPYGVVLAADGSYLLDVTVTLRNLPEPARGAYVAWVTTTQVDRIERLGALEDGRVQGRVAWNKFLVVVTLEDADDPDAATWSGPIVLRGMSRSGMMHTMAGHGPFQKENCAAYGYED